MVVLAIVNSLRRTKRGLLIGRDECVQGSVARELTVGCESNRRRKPGWYVPRRIELACAVRQTQSGIFSHLAGLFQRRMPAVVAQFAKTSTTKGTKVHEGKPEN
jgi:hypothetical protein